MSLLFETPPSRHFVERVAIADALAALSKQGDEFANVAASLGLTIRVDDP